MIKDTTFEVRVNKVEGGALIAIDATDVVMIRKEKGSPFTEIEVKNGARLYTFEKIEDVLHKLKHVLREIPDEKVSSIVSNVGDD